MANPAEIDRLLAQIDDADVRQDWERVRELAQRVLELDPENDDAG